MKKTQNIKVIIAISIALIVGIGIGSFFSSSGTPESPTEVNPVHDLEAHDEVWTCSMHPQVRQPAAGDCPICGMDLILLISDGDGGIDPDAIAMTPAAMKLARVETQIVGGSSANEKTLKLNGKITEDERLIYIQSSHIPGRIEDLKINFTGEYVSKGQVIGRIYSPDLVTAQQELFEARKIKDTQPALYNAAMQKLKNWKLGESTIQKISDAETIQENLPITAGISGYVTEKLVNPGDYIGQGQPLYKIANLSEVWVMFDIYESEMQWINKGDKVDFTVASLPGKTFSGAIDFIDPKINSETRVAKARLSVKNRDNQLKPEMFVSGEIKTQLSGSAQIAVPKTAVMWTGKRSIVYIMEQTKTSTTFEMREVTLGATLGDSYLITEGLKVGDEIAVNGTFSIDAAAQLAGKPSMMSPEDVAVTTGHNHGGMKMENERGKTVKIKAEPETVAALNKIVDLYLQLKSALVNDDFPKAKTAAEKLNRQMTNTSMKSFKGKSHDVWMQELTKIQSALGQMKDIDSARGQLETVSEGILKLLKATHYSGRTIYVDFCPMANNNQGAIWLSGEEDIKNPYFGSAMLGCGEIHETIEK